MLKIEQTISEWMDEVHQDAVEHGWWGEPDIERNIPECLALIHSEVSEGLEDYRKYGRDRLNLWTEREDGKPEGFPTEMADVVIRVFDLCAHLGIDLEFHIRNKCDFNKTRPHRHGGKHA